MKTAAYTRRKTKPFADDEALPDIVPHIQRLRISTAELEQAKSTEDRRLFSEDLSKEARKEVMIAEMALLSEQLDETRQVARQARKHKEDLLKRETDWNAEFLEAVTQMQNKVRSAEEKAKDRPAVQSSVVLKRRASLNKLVGKLMDNMRSFLDVSFVLHHIFTLDCQYTCAAMCGHVNYANFRVLLLVSCRFIIQHHLSMTSELRIAEQIVEI